MKQQTKKLLVLLMAAMMLLSFFPCIAAEETEEAVNHIINGGFEELDDNGYPVNWVQYKPGGSQPWNPEIVKISSKTANSGQNSLLVSNPNGFFLEGALCDVHGGEEGFLEDGLYEFSFYYNGEFETKTGGIKLYAEFYNGDAFNTGYAYPSRSGEIIVEDTNNLWMKASADFVIPAGCKTVTFYIGIWGCIGDVYFDDCAVRLSSGPEKYTFDIEDTFLYPDQTGSTAYVQMDKFYPLEDAQNTKVDFQLVDVIDGTVLKEQKDVPFSGYRASFPFDASLMEQMKRKYTVRAVWKDAVSGETLGSFERNIYRYPRPEMINDEGVCIINGEPFMPVLAYHLDAIHFQQAKEMGINIVEIFNADPEAIKRVLDQAQDAGLMALISMDGSGLIGNGNEPKPIDDAIAVVKRIVREVKDHPALFGYTVNDEPFCGIRGAELDDARIRAEEGYIAIHELDTYHPVFFVDPYPGFQQSWKYTDLFARDIYVYSSANTEKVTAGMTDTHDFVQGKRPLMEVVLSQKSATTETIRGSLYRAMEAGCSALGFYTYSNYQGDGDGGSRTPFHEFPTYEPTKRLMQEEIPLMYDHFILNEGKLFSLFESDAEEGLGLYFAGWTKGSDLYMIIHNRDYVEKTVSVPLVSSNGAVTIGDYHAEPVGATLLEGFDGSGKLEIAMLPDQCAMLKITPENKINEAALDAESEINHAIPAEYRQTESADTTNGFADLGEYEWAREQIETLYEAGVVNSLNTYRPGDSITRGDAAMYLVRALGLTGEGTEPFSDVPDDAYYAAEILTGKSLGLFNGVGNNCFQPEGFISRQDLLVITARAMRLKNTLAKCSDLSVLDKYSDKNMIADYALADMADVTAAGIIQGDGQNVNPTGNTTRAEAAVIMHRAMEAPVIETEKETPDDTVEKPEIELPAETLSDAVRIRRENAVRMLRAIGVLDSALSPETGITNTQASKAITNVFGASGLPSDDAPVTYGEAIKELMDALGYTVYAEAEGGYPAGYMILANRENLLDGVALKEGDNLSVAAFARLLRNAIEADIVEAKTFGSGSMGEYAKSGKTPLDEYLHITAHKGQITADYFRTLTGAPLVRKNQVALENQVFEEGKSGAKAFFGQKTVAFTKENTAGMDEILYIEAATATTVLTVDARNADVDSTTREFRYEKDGKEKTIGIDSGAAFVFNGREKTLTDGNIVPEMGTVTLISNTGSDADVVVIESYKNKIVETVSPLQKKITFKDGSVLVVDEEDSEKRIEFLGKDGGKTSVDNLSEWNVVSIAQSDDGAVARAVTSSDTVKGEITELTDDTAVIEDIVYEVDTTLPEGTLQLGEEKRYALDFQGRIAAVTDKVSSTNYGYLLGMHLKSGVDSTLSVKILTAENEVIGFPCADNLSLSGRPVSTVEFYGDASLRTGNTVKKQIVTYETNDFGELTAMNVAIDGTLMTHEERQSAFSLDYYKNNFLYYLGELGTNTYCDKYKVMGSTVLFVVPIIESDRDDDYKVVSTSTLTTGYNFDSKDNSLYDINADYTISAMVMKTGSNAVTVPNDSPHGLITGKRTIIDEDGAAVTGFDVIGAAGAKAFIQIPDEVEFDFGVPNRTSGTITTAEDVAATGTFSAEDLNVGDVIQYQIGFGNTVKNARVLFRAQTPADTEVSYGGMGDIGELWNYNQLYFGFGTVKEVYDHGVLMKSTYEHLYVKAGYKTKSFPVIIYDQKRGTFTISNDSEIQVGDKLFVSRYYAVDNLWVIYR